MPNVPGLRDQCRTGWPADQPRPPLPVIVATDPVSGLVRLTVPHDPAGNTAQGNTSQYCTTLEMSAERWRDVIEAIEATLPETTDPASTVEAVIAR